MYFVFAIFLGYKSQLLLSASRRKRIHYMIIINRWFLVDHTKWTRWPPELWHHKVKIGYVYGNIIFLKEKSRQKKSSCSGKMWTTTSLLVCVCSLGVSRVCADPDFLKVNLLEEVDNPRIIHQLINISRPNKHQSVNISRLNKHQLVNISRLNKRQSVNISWLNKPPYIYDENSARSGKNREKLSEKTTNSTEEAQVKQENVKGIFYEIINKGLHLRKQVALAMKDTWPVIVITLLLTGFVGLIIWGLVSTRLCRKIFCLLYLKYNKYVNYKHIAVRKNWAAGTDWRPWLRDRRLWVVLQEIVFQEVVFDNFLLNIELRICNWIAVANSLLIWFKSKKNKNKGKAESKK